MTFVLFYLFTAIYLGPLAYFVILTALDKARYEITAMLGSWLLSLILAWITLHYLGDSPMKLILFAMGATTAFAVAVYLTQPKYQACFDDDPTMCIGADLLTQEEADAYYDGRKLVNDNQRNYVDQMAEE